MTFTTIKILKNIQDSLNFGVLFYNTTQNMCRLLSESICITSMRCGSESTAVNMLLMPLPVETVIKPQVFDSGVSCLLLSSMKLWQTNLLT